MQFTILRIAKKLNLSLWSLSRIRVTYASLLICSNLQVIKKLVSILLLFSDPYVRIDLNTINDDINIDSVLTKTKKKVCNNGI